MYPVRIFGREPLFLHCMTRKQSMVDLINEEMHIHFPEPGLLVLM